MQKTTLKTLRNIGLVVAILMSGHAYGSQHTTISNVPNSTIRLQLDNKELSDCYSAIRMWHMKAWRAVFRSDATESEKYKQWAELSKQDMEYTAMCNDAFAWDQEKEERSGH